MTDLENTIRKIKARQEEDLKEDSDSDDFDEEKSQSFMKTDEQQKAAEAEANHN